MTTLLLVAFVLGFPGDSGGWILWEQTQNETAPAGLNFNESRDRWVIVRAHETLAGCEPRANTEISLVHEGLKRQQAGNKVKDLHFYPAMNQVEYTADGTVNGKSTALTITQRYVCLPSDFDPRPKPTH